MKKIVALLVVLSFVSTCGAFAISKNEPFKRAASGLDNIVYGNLETPDNINKTNSKGKKAFDDCTDTTKDDVGRGIARVVGGLWQLATFWYPTD
ncbi:MAG: hypothetical protein ABID09_07675 [Candidatus Omnitrophota bacterium]